MFRPDPKPEPRPKKKPARIRNFSVKREKTNRQYNAEAKEFVKGKRCAVYPQEPATMVHHMKGRKGYADDWARDNDVPLLLDKRFWLPVGFNGHRKIEDNPAWAKEKGYSLDRLSKNHGT